MVPQDPGVHRVLTDSPAHSCEARSVDGHWRGCRKGTQLGPSPGTWLRSLSLSSWPTASAWRQDHGPPVLTASRPRLAVHLSLLASWRPQSEGVAALPALTGDTGSPGVSLRMVSEPRDPVLFLRLWRSLKGSAFGGSIRGSILQSTTEGSHAPSLCRTKESACL